MQTRNPALILISLPTVLVVLYPVLGLRTPESKPAVPAKIVSGTSETTEGEPANPGFPSAKDLVAKFLFSRGDEHANLPDKVRNEAYNIEFLIATVPDPIDSRLPNFFDSFAESIGSAAEAAHYTLDSFALPWMEANDGDQKRPPLWRQTLYDSVPGLILFRNPHELELLLIFLVGETPTTGIHKQAMFSALDQMAQFYPLGSSARGTTSKLPSGQELGSPRRSARHGSGVFGIGGFTALCVGPLAQVSWKHSQLAISNHLRYCHRHRSQSLLPCRTGSGHLSGHGAPRS